MRQTSDKFDSIHQYREEMALGMKGTANSVYWAALRGCSDPKKESCWYGRSFKPTRKMPHRRSASPFRRQLSATNFLRSVQCLRRPLVSFCMGAHHIWRLRLSVESCRAPCRHWSSSSLLPSGHSRWSKIKHDKGKVDRAKSKARSQLSADIIMASKRRAPQHTVLSSSTMSFKG